MLRILAEPKKLARASRQLQRQIRGGKPVECTLGHPGDSEKCTVWWHANAGVWSTQKREKNRVATLVGISEPKEGSQLGIAVVINSPIRKIDRSVAGIFLEAGRGQICLGHRGNRIHHVTKKQFRQRLKNGQHWRWILVADGDREREVIVLRSLRDPLLMAAIGAFAREVRRIKKLVR